MLRRFPVICASAVALAMCACSARVDSGLSDELVHALPSGGHVIVVRSGIEQGGHCTETQTVKRAVKWLLRLGARVDTVFADPRCAGQLYIALGWTLLQHTRVESDRRQGRDLKPPAPSEASAGEPQPADYHRGGHVRVVVVANSAFEIIRIMADGEAVVHQPGTSGGMQAMAKLDRDDWCPTPCRRTSLGESRSVTFPGYRPTWIAARPSGGVAVALGGGRFAMTDSGGLRAVRFDLGPLDPTALAVTNNDRVWVADGKSNAMLLADHRGAVQRRVIAPAPVAWLLPFDNGVVWGRTDTGDLFWISPAVDQAVLLPRTDLVDARPDIWEVALRDDGRLTALNIEGRKVVTIDPVASNRSVRAMTAFEAEQLSRPIILNHSPMPRIGSMHGTESSAVARAHWLLRGRHGAAQRFERSEFLLDLGDTLRFAGGGASRCERTSHCFGIQGEWSAPFDAVKTDQQIWLSYPDRATIELFDAR